MISKELAGYLQYARLTEDKLNVAANNGNWADASEYANALAHTYQDIAKACAVLKGPK